MTEEELQKLLENEELLKRLDVKTLVLDLYSKHIATEELVRTFMQKLPELDEAYVKRFFYMKRK
ncbi:MAG: hypothetical protein AB1782_02700 [Cyanobacteriota bacterium]